MLMLKEADIAGLFDMSDVVGAVEACLRGHGVGGAANLPRRRISVGATTMHVLGGALHDDEVCAAKVHTTGGGPNDAWNLLFRASGQLLAMIEAESLSLMRTGAASGVATKWLSNPGSHTVAVLGTGRQAMAQLEAVSAVRPVAQVRAWSPTPAHRQAFCEDVHRRLELPAEPASDPRATVAGASVVITISKATDPFLRGEWLEAGAHVNLAGANRRNRREATVDVFERAGVVTVDDPEQAQYESGELIEAVEQGALTWDQVSGLGAVVAGAHPGRQATDELTVFKSLGIGLEDTAVSLLAYERATAAGRGVQV